jgi:hypothetical protein
VLLLCGGIVSIIVYVVFVVFVMRPTGRAAEIPPAARETNIYIGPSGMPVSLAEGKDLRFFSSETVRLKQVKINVGSSPSKITLSDAEPDDIKPGEIFTKILEQPLSDGIRQLLILKSPILLVEGTAKCSDKVGRNFTFQTMPLLM